MDSALSALSPQYSALSTQPTSSFTQVVQDLLRAGRSVRFRATGSSMRPAIMHGDYVTVVPVSPDEVTEGDIILYQANSKLIAHRVIRVCDTAPEPLRSGRDRSSLKDRELHSFEAKELSKETQDTSSYPSVSNSLKRQWHPPRAKRLSRFAVLNGPRPTPQGGCAGRQSCSSSRSSALSTQHCFILRGDAHVTDDHPVSSHKILGKVTTIKRPVTVRIREGLRKLLRIARAHHLHHQPSPPILE